MFKKLFLVACLIFLASKVSAEEFSLSGALDKIPSIKQGVAFSLADSNLNYMSTINVANFGKYINLDVGYAGRAKNTGDKLIAAVSFNLLESGYIQYPILRYLQVKPCLFLGYGNINAKEITESEFDYGIGVTIFEVKL